uniref:Ground-like domain-containing protein n=1 Tax=Steinernema glaseri TaxID=37863 RepID=A0A1I7Z1V7_9BILA
MFQVSVVFLLVAASATKAFLFNFGCSCQPPPLCPPPPVCPAPEPCVPVPCQPVYTQDCCATCPRPCRFRTVHRRVRRQNGVIDDPPVTITNAKCNSERLRVVIRENPYQAPSQAKRFIQDMAERQFDIKFNVICARGDFSYITNTDEYCQETYNDLTCYVFKHFGRNIIVL